MPTDQPIDTVTEKNKYIKEYPDEGNAAPVSDVLQVLLCKWNP